MLEQRRVLIIACDRQAALRGRDVLQASGYDVTMLWSSIDVQSHFPSGQFEAVVVANSFNDPERMSLVLAEILSAQDQTSSSIRS
jgi:hypothetical protein